MYKDYVFSIYTSITGRTPLVRRGPPAGATSIGTGRAAGPTMDRADTVRRQAATATCAGVTCSLRRTMPATSRARKSWSMAP